MKRNWIIVSILVIVGLIIYIGLFLFPAKKEMSYQKKSEGKVRNPENTNIVIKVEPEDTVYKIYPDEMRIFYGSNDAPIKIILFADFSDKSSLNMINVFKNVIGERKDFALYLYTFPVYKNELSIPLSTLFILSIQSGRKENFIKWLDGREGISREDIIEFAKDNQLDLDLIFKQYGEDGLSKLPALSDMNMGVNFGVSIPPTYFIQGVRKNGEKNSLEIERLLRSEYEKVENMIKNGVPREDVYDEIVKSGKEVAFKLEVVDREKIEKNEADRDVVISEEDLRYVPYKGPRYAPVTMVLFVDYECPYTKRYYPIVKNVIEKYPEDLRVFVKHYPLSSHKRSFEIARYLASALAQKKFWVLFDKIMEYPEFVDDKKIEEIAVGLGLNINELREMKDSDKIKRYVENDTIKGAELNLRVLPTTYINGVKYEGVISASRLEKIIEEEKKVADRLLSEGIKKEEVYDNLVKRNRLKNLLNLNKQGKKPYIEKIK
ncbi:MAG: thioredoxin domain-containing protein [Myxococcota bacterium]